MACRAGTATFTVTAAGTGPLTYQWRNGITPIDTTANPSAATATLTLMNVQISDSNVYDCVVSDLCGSVTSDPAMLTVNDCAVDVNCDQAVTSADFFDFLTAFFTNAPAADFDHDGIVTSQDFFGFLAAFFAGC